MECKKTKFRTQTFLSIFGSKFILHLEQEPLKSWHLLLMVVKLHMVFAVLPIQA